jgi:hypothetical protein
VNTQSNPNNCGGCGLACDKGNICRDAHCVCPGGFEACDADGGTQCTNTRNDAANCGGCGRSCDGGRCVNGDCR